MIDEAHPKDVPCETCSGSGYDSAARRAGYTAESMKTANPMHIPLGVWPCTSCNGTGKLIDGAKMEQLENQLKEYVGDNKGLINGSILTEKDKKKD